MRTLLGKLLAGLLLVALAPAAAYGSTPAAKSFDQKKAKAQVEAAYHHFFAGPEVDLRASGLENGTKHLPEIQQAVDTGANKGIDVSIHSVKFKKNHKTADVAYDLTLNGTPVLTDRLGTAKLVGKNWVLSEVTYCALAELGGPLPDTCAGVLNR